MQFYTITEVKFKGEVKIHTMHVSETDAKNHAKQFVTRLANSGYTYKEVNKMSCVYDIYEPGLFNGHVLYSKLYVIHHVHNGVRISAK